MTRYSRARAFFSAHQSLAFGSALRSTSIHRPLQRLVCKTLIDDIRYHSRCCATIAAASEAQPTIPLPPPQQEAPPPPDEEQHSATFGASIPFSDLGLHEDIVLALDIINKSVSTHIQSLAIPRILTGEDVIIGSETGAGKTLAYLLPIFQRIYHSRQANTRQSSDQTKANIALSGPDGEDEEFEGPIPAPSDLEEPSTSASGYSESSSSADSPPTDYRYDVPHALILVPNRQLAEQVISMAEVVLKPLPGTLNIETLPATLGDWPYRRRGRPAPDLLVCTPAALSGYDKRIDLFEGMKTLVMDEADMLLEGDFGRHLDRILVAFKRADKEHAARQEPKTQYVLSAATIPSYGLKSIELLVKKRFPTATRVNTDLMHRHHPRLRQSFLQVPNSLDSKISYLLGILRKMEEKAGSKADLPKTMIFLNSATAAQRAYEQVRRSGYAAVPFHKEVNGHDREHFLREFRKSRVFLMVCTDLASRGLDIPDVKQVIQVEFATNLVQHLHRIGRAVRAGREGRAISLYDEGSEDLVESLKMAGDESLARSFSRQRGFRKKIKRYGRDYYRPQDQRQEGPLGGEQQSATG